MRKWILVLVMSIMSFPAAAADHPTLMRLVCQRESNNTEVEVKIDGVIILEQVDGSEYDGTVMMEYGVGGVPKTNPVDFRLFVFPLSTLTSIESGYEQEAQDLLDSKSVKRRIHGGMTVRSGNNFVFEWDQPDLAANRGGKFRYLSFMPYGNLYDDYENHDAGFFACAPPYTIPAEDGTQLAQ